MFIAKLVSVSTALSFLLISNFANAENFTIEMLNKLGKERMVYSEKVISIKVNDERVSDSKFSLKKGSSNLVLVGKKKAAKINIK